GESDARRQDPIEFLIPAQCSGGPQRARTILASRALRAQSRGLEHDLGPSSPLLPYQWAVVVRGQMGRRTVDLADSRSTLAGLRPGPRFSCRFTGAVTPTESTGFAGVSARMR